MPVSDKAYLAKYLSGSTAQTSSRRLERGGNEGKIIIPKSYGGSSMGNYGDEEDDELQPVVIENNNNIRERVDDHSKKTELLKRKRNDSDDDLSPVKNKKEDITENINESRRRHDSDDEDEDLSPPRKPMGVQSSNIAHHNYSAKSKLRHDSDEDLSPPRQPATTITKRHDSDDEDLSPPRNAVKPNVVTEKKNRHDSDEDLSPVRNVHHSKNMSNVEISTVSKRRHDSDDDLSPLRKPLTTSSTIPSNDKHSTTAPSSDVIHQQLSRRLTGGETETTVYRHPETKKIISFEEYAELMKKKKKQTKKITQNEISWAKGLKQKEEWQEMQDELDKSKSEAYKPIYAQDASLNEHLKDQLKEEDPMARILAEKKTTEEKIKHKKIRKVYLGPAPENRFDIRPGWRWDGVDRSNGFEAQYFKRMSENLVKESEEFMWNNADL
ncbi:hypothetical protein C9374_008735 [Naegleria lovaniensis]|uniref:Pre-mRNA-splicing factor CWC26 n=1 Tax=Naegleria lovaniensis TaxID=51637 RepID=A0AA88GL20_NAELO|nr:uncharacterized protein C9374_008735 [Naegleria lovaniensis]KAG2378113.1 hypothetical protein C9374_008735 [Naegleria lovaniensis]